MSVPLISIITICRNASGSIRRCLESVAAQSDPALFEHWVIDGVSTDGTQDIVRSFPHAKLDSRPDGGIAEAFNRGVRLSQGNWILFLNADDAFAGPEVLARAAAALDTTYDLVYGRVALMDEALEHCRYLWGDEEGWKHLAHRQTIPHPSLFTNRRMFEKFGLFDESFRVAMDYEWLLRSHGKARCRFVSETITLFRSGGASAANGTLRQARECWRAKAKNGVGTPVTRALWFYYQSLRSFLDAWLPGVPVLGWAYSQCVAAVRKSH